jgi:hypothetical protein
LKQKRRKNNQNGWQSKRRQNAIATRENSFKSKVNKTNLVLPKRNNILKQPKKKQKLKKKTKPNKLGKP